MIIYRLNKIASMIGKWRFTTRIYSRNSIIIILKLHNIIFCIRCLFVCRFSFLWLISPSPSLHEFRLNARRAYIRAKPHSKTRLTGLHERIREIIHQSWRKQKQKIISKNDFNIYLLWLELIIRSSEWDGFLIIILLCTYIRVWDAHFGHLLRPQTRPVINYTASLRMRIVSAGNVTDN